MMFLEMSLLAMAACGTAQDGGQSLYRLLVGPDGGAPVGGVMIAPERGKSPVNPLLSFKDFEGSYAVPHIQSSRGLHLILESTGLGVAYVRIRLVRNGQVHGESRLDTSDRQWTLHDLPPGEYSLQVEAQDANGKRLASDTYGPIGVGAVIAAIGDSITEGYYGRGFHADTARLTAAGFPKESVSKDGRNFPQFAPTTATHLPEVNCFESWMTRLNDRLSGAWKHPVFIANEGWGGISTAGYLELMTKSANWRERMQLLRPNVWLIHLGVNDERAQVSRGEFARNMEQIVELLRKDYGAAPERIFVAKPCFDYFEGAEPILKGYCEEIDKLATRLKLGAGADFFAGYAQDKARWYGGDPVHPNVEGMNRMADLWCDALVRALPNGFRP